MSIVRVIVVDPEPTGPDDLIVYQVPEHSRAHKLLISLCEQAGLQHVTIEAPKAKPRRKPQAPVGNWVPCAAGQGYFHLGAELQNACLICNPKPIGADLG